MTSVEAFPSKLYDKSELIDYKQQGTPVYLCRGLRTILTTKGVVVSHLHDIFTTRVSHVFVSLMNQTLTCSGSISFELNVTCSINTIYLITLNLVIFILSVLNNYNSNRTYMIIGD